MPFRIDLDADFPRFRRAGTARERAADLCIHVLGLMVAGVGAGIMIDLALGRDGPARFVAVVVYATGLITMLGASAAYNVSCSLADETRLRALLRRCDHSAILLMIAGTFTPFAVSRASALSGMAATVGVWLASVGGIALKWLAPSLFERCAVGLFLGLGWLALSVMWSIGASLPPASIAALLAGSALYSVGIVFHLWRSLPFQNAIWHGFVLAAAICHYFSILDAVVLPRAIS